MWWKYIATETFMTIIHIFGTIGFFSKIKVMFMMDFELANQWADRISRGENGGLHKKLVSLCMPYFFYLKRRFGFNDISSDDIKKELANSAVNMAASIKGEKGKPFTICLQNAFRDCCRELQRIIDETRINGIRANIGEAQVEARATMAGGRKMISPVFEAQKQEEIEAVCGELIKHEKFSKEIIIKKMRGSTYQEMALSFNEPFSKCKKVYWHDLNIIRNNLKGFYKEEDYYTV